MALDTENMNVYKVETDNDIYNVVRNYDINKLFDKLVVPNATKEQLKDNLKKALNEKNNDEALRILNYLLKYKHNYYKRNDILLDDESPSSQEKTITLKDAGYYEIIFEGASSKSPWYSSVSDSFEHFLVKGSPWYDDLNLDKKASQKCLFLLKNFNYLLLSKIEDDSFEAYLGQYELNDKGCFLYKKYKSTLNENQFLSIIDLFNDKKNVTYEALENFINFSIIRNYKFIKLEDAGLLDYFEYNSSAFAAYGSRQIFLENVKTLFYSQINKEHQVYLKGAGAGDNDSFIADLKDNIIYDDVLSWLTSNDKTYEQKDYYKDFCQTVNLSPMGESAYFSTIQKFDSNSPINYLLKGFNDVENSVITINNEKTIIPKAPIIKVEQSVFDRNSDLSKKEDHKYVGHTFEFDYDVNHLNASLKGFKGGGKKGYGPHMNHQDNCYWCNGEDSQIRIRFLGDADLITKRVFFPNENYESGKRISLKGEESSIKGYNYVDIPSGSIIEFKYKCSSVRKSLNFDKCQAIVLRNNSSVYDTSYSVYGYEKDLDSRTVDTQELLKKLNKTEDILFKKVVSDKINLSEIYNNIGSNKWTMGELFFNNSNLISKDGENFVNFKIDKDWNYYTISFKVFDNILLDFGTINDEVDYYNNVILTDLESTCNEATSQKEYFNKSNIHDESNFISQITLANKTQDRIIDDNLNSLYNKNYYNTVSFDSGESVDYNGITNILDSEKLVENRLDKYHDYKIFCEQFEKIYITIKAGNQVVLSSINKNIPYGDYGLPREGEDYSGYIKNFFFKRTAVSEEQLYTKRISVKQGEFIYFKCEYNSCRVEIDKELSYLPDSALVYPVNYDPFKNKYYSLNPEDYPQEEGYKGYKGYEKNTSGTTFQWLRFTTSNSSYDIVIFLKKITVEISFLNDLFGQNLITKNYDNNKFEPNESFSFYVKLPANCRISTYKYSNKMTYSYAEDDFSNYKDYFNNDAYESLISFYSGNSRLLIKNFKDYVYDLPNILGAYNGMRSIYDLFKSTFTSIDQKVQHFSSESVLFSFEAKYANSMIRITEDYIVGSQIFENFTGTWTNQLLVNGLYRLVATSGNTGNGGHGGTLTPNAIYAGIISGAGGGGLNGGKSGLAQVNHMVSPVDKTHPFFTFTFRIDISFWIGFSISIWKWSTSWGTTITLFEKTWPARNFGMKSVSGGSSDTSVGTLGFSAYLGVGSGCGGNGFYKAGDTDGDGSWFIGSLRDRLLNGNSPLVDSEILSDDDWTLNYAFKNSLESSDFKNQKGYFINCFAGNGNVVANGILQGTNYLSNNFNERYRGVFFDAILNIGSSSNNKINIISQIGSSGKEGNNGSNTIINEQGILENMPKNGVCGQEGKPTLFEFDDKSYYSIISSSYFTNIPTALNGISQHLQKGLLCGGVHDVAPQKSFNVPSNWKDNTGSAINAYLEYLITHSKTSVYYYTKDNNSGSYDEHWKGIEVDKIIWDETLARRHTFPKQDATFGSFAYASCQWFWMQIDMTFQISTYFKDFDDWFPITFDITKGFEFLINADNYIPYNGIPVKYRAIELPLAWDTKSHTIYEVSATNVGISSLDVKDGYFSKYNPSNYIDLDNNSHFQVPYPFSWINSSFVPESTLNGLFKKNESDNADSSGNKYSEIFKKSLYSFFECYKNFNLSTAIWEPTYNIYKNNTLCVSNIGLTQKIEDGKPTYGKLLNLNASSFIKVDKSAIKKVNLRTDYLNILNDIYYKALFTVSPYSYEIPIDGYNASTRSTLQQLLNNKSIAIYDNDFVTKKAEGKPTKIVYTSEAFSNAKYSGNLLSVDYLKDDSKIIFKNNESPLVIFKLHHEGNYNYSVSSHGLNDANSQKFIFEIKNNSQSGKVLYTSLNPKGNFQMNYDKENILLITSYDYLLLKEGQDFYIIMFDNENTLFGNIVANPIIQSSINNKVLLNYYLEYPTSRGRVPLINDSVFEMTFLGRDIDKLNDEDKPNHRIAYIYGGMLYDNVKAQDYKEIDANYLDLKLIDEKYDYTALIDYKHICNGDAILNSSSSDWLKI